VLGSISNTILTWLNTTATITLVSKIGMVTIQSRPPFDTGKRFLSHYFCNRLWAPLSAASNQVNTVIMVSQYGGECGHHYKII